jgi:hypothetical protein
MLLGNMHRVGLYLAAICACSAALATEWHIRTDGHDNRCNGLVNASAPDSGINQPCAFFTIQKGIDTAIAADTITIHSGTFFETVDVTKALTIQGATGESVTIDSGVNYARTVPNTDWTLVDAATGEYKSNFLVTGSQDYIFGYITSVKGYENGYVPLIPYDDTRNSSGRFCEGGTRNNMHCTATNETQCPGGGVCVTYCTGSLNPCATTADCSSGTCTVGEVCTSGCQPNCGRCGLTGYSMFRATTETYNPQSAFYAGPGTWLSKQCVGGLHAGQVCDIKAGSYRICSGGSEPGTYCTVDGDCAGSGQCMGSCTGGTSAGKPCRVTGDCSGIGAACGDVGSRNTSCIDDDTDGTLDTPGSCEYKRCSTTTTQYCGGTADCPGGETCSNIGEVRIRLQKTADLSAYEATYGSVLAADKDNPGNYSILLSRATNTVKISSSGVTLRNLTIHPAVRTIQYDPTAGPITSGTIGGATEADGNTIWIGDKAIIAGNTATDFPVSNIMISYNRLYGATPRWTFWTDGKNLPFPTDHIRSQAAVDMRKGSYNWEIKYNHIRGGYDGIGMNNCEYGVLAHHNRIENLFDDAFEIEAANPGAAAVHACYRCVGGDKDLEPCPNGTECTGGGTCTAGPYFVGQIDVYENFMSNVHTCNAVGQSTGTMLSVCSGGTEEGKLCTSTSECAGGGTCIGDSKYYRNICVQLHDTPIARVGRTPGAPTAAGIRQFNGEWKEGYEYALKTHSFTSEPTNRPRLFYYYNTFVLLNHGVSPGANRGINVVPGTPFGFSQVADTWVKNNIYAKVNNATQGVLSAVSYTGQVLDYDIYWHMNDLDGDSSLVVQQASIPEFCAAYGLECHGKGHTPTRGDNPIFHSWAPQLNKAYSPRWQVFPVSENANPADFLLASVSPARGMAEASHVDPRGAGFPALPDTRCPPPYTDPGCLDIGAVPYGTTDEWQVFPFNQGFVPRATRIRGVRLQGASIR